MVNLIDKSTLMAEIEKAIDEPAPSHDQQCPWEDGYYCGLYKAESVIDALEVKEVDLEKEAEQFVQSEYFIYNEESPILLIAKHFFELGLKAQKRE